MEQQDTIIKLLQDLLGEVRLLTVQTKATASERFAQEYLTSDLRRQMYSSFDGNKTLQEISKDIGCKINTLQVFAQSLVENDLVDVQTKGTARVLDRSVTKLALYYAKKDMEEGK